MYKKHQNNNLQKFTANFQEKFASNLVGCG